MESKLQRHPEYYLLIAIDAEMNAVEKRLYELEAQRREVINKYNLNKGVNSVVAPTSRSQRILDAKP